LDLRLAGRLEQRAESVARAQAKTGNLVLAPVTGARLRRQVNLVAPAAPPGSAAGQAFIGSVRNFLDDEAGRAASGLLS
jgi:hypothetical protein